MKSDEEWTRYASEGLSRGEATVVLVVFGCVLGLMAVWML